MDRILPFSAGLILVVLGFISAPAFAARPVEQMVEEISKMDGEARGPASGELMDALLPQLRSENEHVRWKALAYLSCVHSSATDRLKQEQGSPELRQDVKDQLGRLCAVLKQRARADARRVANRAWVRRASVEVYDTVGRHDTKWDAAGHDALALWISDYSDAKRCLGAADQAIAAGCDDALVLFTQAYLSEQLNPKAYAENARRIADAAEKLAKSQYPACWKCIASQELAQAELALAGNQFEQKEQATKRAEAAVAQAEMYLPQAVKEGVSQRMLVRSMQGIAGIKIRLGQPSEKTWTGLFDLVDPIDPKLWAHLYCKGVFYTKYAWEARGSGWASSVTEEGWDLMARRLETAAAALEEGWRRNPGDPFIPSAMLTVELGQGKGRERMELWYQRAMDLDPDYREPVDAKIYYLEPKWHGSAEDMLEFAKELELQGNWHAGYPVMVMDAHRRLARYDRSLLPGAFGANYWAQPSVWGKVQRVMDRQLELFPWNAAGRTLYAKVACEARQWETADRLFREIGDHPAGNAFSGQAEYDAFRKGAAAQVKRVGGAN